MCTLSRLLFLILSGLLFFGPVSYGRADESLKVDSKVRQIRLGIAITPKNFPAHTITDVDEAFSMAKELGDHAVFIYQWSELNREVARLMVEKSSNAGLIPILGLSPTTLDKGRKELDLPTHLRLRAGQFVSFANRVIRDAFKSSVEDLARLRPPYLCLATEINFLALQRLDEYLHFASLYKGAYREVKRISPNTKVFVSFQWEWVRIHDAREMHKIKEHSKVIDIFRPELDVMGLTTYPSPFHVSPAKLPLDYYFWIYHHIKSTDEVLLMEVGWPTSGSGDEQEQHPFIRRLPELLNRVNVSVIAWVLLHDVSLAEFDADLNTVGLVTSHGQRKIGYEAFKALNETLP